SCIAAATLLPQMFRHVRTAARMEGLYVKLRITDVGGRVTVLALLDSGNLLVEPVTGLPVVLLNACPGETAGGYPVRYAGVGGEGEVLCRHAKRAQVWLNGRWREIDVMIAKSPRHIAEAQAIIGGIALPPQG
ncbi:MAG: sigma-E processing peptidase SpoIIGA, partial [Clostridiales bacterium]|nr:sigma-E processing peptidase SpoIIGA [Clostridiales bacterium]